jgi:hypothetical protein
LQASFPASGATASEISFGSKLLGVFETGSKALGVVGDLSIAASFVSAVRSAQTSINANNPTAAAQTMVNWAGETEGGLEGAELFSGIAAEAAAPLLAFGPFGAIGYGAVVLTAGIVGWSAGSKTASALLSTFEGAANPQNNTPPNGSDATLSQTLSTFSVVAGALPPSGYTPSYDSSGYDQYGFNSSGYDILGRNASGALDPSIGSSGETNTNVLSDDTETFHVNEDGSSTGTISFTDGPTITQTRNSSNVLTNTTTTTSGGTTTSQSYDPTTGNTIQASSGASAGASVDVQTSTTPTSNASATDGGSVTTNVAGDESTTTIQAASDGSTIAEITLSNGTTLESVYDSSGDLINSLATNANSTFTSDSINEATGVISTSITNLDGSITSQTITPSTGVDSTSTGNGGVTFSTVSTQVVSGATDATVDTNNASGTILYSDSTDFSSSGSSVSTDINYSSGTQQGEVVYDQTAAGVISATVSGVDSVVNASNSTITFDANAVGSLEGSNNTIDLDAGVTLNDLGAGSNTITDSAATGSLIGNDDQMTVSGTGGTVTVGGIGDTVTASHETISLGSDTSVAVTGSTDVIEGSNETITLGSGFTGTIDGSNDTINMVGGSASSVTISGTGNTVSGDSGTDSVSLTSASDTLTVSGTDGTINIGATGDTLTTSTEYVDATSGEALTVDGTSDAITGTSNTITLGSDFNGNVTGNSMTIDMNDGTGSAGSNTGVGLYGSSFTVNDDDGSNYVNLESANETGTVNGDGTVQVFATGDHLTSSNQYVYVNNTGLSLSITGGSDAIQGDDDTVSTSSGFQGNIYGDEMTVDMTGNSDSAFGVYGTHFTVNNNTGSNYINLVSAGQTGTISGTGGLVQIYADDVSLTDSHETILNNVDLSDNSITGTNDSIYGYLDTNISISGTSDTFTGNYNSGIDFGTTHTADTVIGSADSGTDWANTTGFENEDGDEQYYYASGSTDQTSFYVIPDSEFNSNTEAFIESGFAHGADSSNAGAGSYGNAPSFSGYSGSPPDTDEFGSGGGYYGGSGSGYYDDPLVLNLSGQSVQTEGRFHSAAHFDMQNNGKQVQTGWVTPGEGLLVLDPTDAPITSASQLLAGFNALDALDSNGDGVLNSSDAAWDQLRVWVDSSGTGQYQTGQLYTLDQLGITSINLNATAVNANSNGNTIEDQSTFTTTSGTGDIAGVSLAFNSDTAGMQLNSLISGMATFHAPQGASTSSPPLPADFSGHEHHHFAAAGVH